MNDEPRADKRVSDRWLRKEEKKSGRRLRIRISVNWGLLFNSRRPTLLLSAVFRAEKILTRTSMEEPLWHCGLFLAYVLAL